MQRSHAAETPERAHQPRVYAPVIRRLRNHAATEHEKRDDRRRIEDHQPRASDLEPPRDDASHGDEDAKYARNDAPGESLEVRP